LLSLTFHNDYLGTYAEAGKLEGLPSSVFVSINPFLSPSSLYAYINHTSGEDESIGSEGETAAEEEIMIAY
jgi:hypothetical protein